MNYKNHYLPDSPIGWLGLLALCIVLGGVGHLLQVTQRGSIQTEQSPFEAESL